MLRIPILLVIALLLVFTIYPIHTKAQHNSLEDQIEQLKEFTVPQRIQTARALFDQNLSLEEARSVLTIIRNSRRHYTKPEELNRFLEDITQQDVDPDIKAYAYSCMAATYREHHNYEETLRYYQLALEAQPTRNQEEWERKLDYAYQIAQEDWYSGRWVKALEAYLNLVKEFSHIDHFLILFAYYEAIPSITVELKNGDQEELITEAIANLQDSDNPGERFAASMMALHLGKLGQSNELAQQTKDLAENKKFDFLQAGQSMLVDLSHRDFDSYKEKFQELEQSAENDAYLCRITSIFGIAYLLFYPEDYGNMFPIYETYLQSDIYTNPERKSKTKHLMNANIRLNHAILMTYHDRHNDFISNLESTFAEYYDTDGGQFAGLILAEHYIQNADLSRAESILNSLSETVDVDMDVKPRWNIVKAKFFEAKGLEGQAKMHLNDTLSIPERKGVTEYERYKRDANRIMKILTSRR